MSTISRSFLICLTVSLLSAVVQAEQTHVWRGISGLHSILKNHLVRVTVSEALPTTAESRVVIELRDRANRVVARKEGPLTFKTPISLDLKVGENVGFLQLRAAISIAIGSDELTLPIVTFEDINPDVGLVIKIDPPCGPGVGHVDPQASCPGWREFTSSQE